MSANFTPEMLGYTGQGPFRYWCQKVLPLVYDDSLSYLEVLHKVTTYLNNTISDVANVETNVDNLAIAFNNLQEYVNEHIDAVEADVAQFEEYVTNYLTNLDVQEEINNKLDDMARSGALGELLLSEIYDPNDPNNSLISQLVSDWLNDAITGPAPGEAVIVDGTLSIGGAAADAKVVGEDIHAMSYSSTFNWSSIGDDTYTTGFRMGQYNDSGAAASSSYQCRTISSVPYHEDTVQMVISPPNGFCAKFSEYDSSGTFIRTVGRVAYNYSSGPVSIKIVQGNKYKVTVGWWTSAMTDADLTNELFSNFTLSLVGIEGQYQIYPTGDTTNRTQEIISILQQTGMCRFAPGDYYINRFLLPDNVSIIGAGSEKTRLICTADATAAYALRVGKNSVISNLSLDYNITDVEATPPQSTYFGALHAIVVGSTSGTTEETEAYNVLIENVTINKFPGCGVFLRNIGYSTNGTTLKNVRTYLCSVGIYLGAKAEYCNVVGCYARRCYTGMCIIGGNNIASACIIGECQNGIVVDGRDSYGYGYNNAHGIIDGCKITHIGFFEGDGVSIYSLDQKYGALIANCMLPPRIEMHGINGSEPVQFVGCQFRGAANSLNINIILDNVIASMFSCLFPNANPEEPGIQLLNNGVLYRTGCLDNAGNILPNVLSD